MGRLSARTPGRSQPPSAPLEESEIACAVQTGAQPATQTERATA